MTTIEFNREREIGFNRKNFVEKILNKDFKGSVTKCAKALKISERSLNRLIFDVTSNAALKTLNKIFAYCVKTQRNPDEYILRRK